MKLRRLPMEPDMPPGRMEVLLRELQDLTASLGEIRLAVNALRERVERMERQSMTGSIAGLPGAWTVTPPPTWDDDIRP